MTKTKPCKMLHTLGCRSRLYNDRRILDLECAVRAVWLEAREMVLDTENEGDMRHIADLMEAKAQEAAK